MLLPKWEHNFVVFYVSAGTYGSDFAKKPDFLIRQGKEPIQLDQMSIFFINRSRLF